MDINELVIGSAHISTDTKVQDLRKCQEFIFDDNSDDEIALVRSNSNQVQFLNGRFYVMFFFGKGLLYKIELYPVLEDVEDPGYPDRKYELKKFEFCKGLLKNTFGEPDEQTDSYVIYENSDYKISTFLIKEGHDRFTGGNILIRMNEF